MLCPVHARPRASRALPSIPLAIVGLLVCLPPAGATTIHVPQQQPTIADGLAAAVPGDTVLVACGTYPEHGLELVTGVVLRSETGQADCVTIDGERQGRVLTGVTLSPQTRVIGFTITGGYDDSGPIHGDRSFGDPEEEYAEGLTRDVELGPWERDYGGGAGSHLILSDLTFESCRFVDNEALTYGGGVRVEGGSPFFIDCEFEGNLAGTQGGGLFVAGSAGTPGGTNEITFIDCLITGNRARSGGGLYASRTTISATRTHVRGNVAERTGGGIASAFSGHVWIEGLIVENGTEDPLPSRGGALAQFGGLASFQGCTFARNDSRNASAVLAHDADVTLENCLVALQTESAPLDCVYGGTIDLTCCDLFGNAGGDYVGCVADQFAVDGNIRANPFFCDAANGDYSLAIGSPCLPDGNPCGLLIGALGPGCDLGALVLVTTVPPGLFILVDGDTMTAPAYFGWVPGSPHEIGTIAPQEPAPGVRHDFVAWSDGGALIHTVIAPDTALVLTAEFTTEYHLTTASSPGGTALPPSGWFSADVPVELTAVPDPDYEFFHWEGSGPGSYTGPENPVTITMMGPVEEFAHFMFSGDYLLTMVADGNGSVSPPTGPYPVGTEVTIEAVPDSGHHFTGWTGQGPGSYTGPWPTATVTMLGDITQIGHFAPTLYTLTMSVQGQGTVEPGSGQYPEGATVALAAYPAQGWLFHEWIGAGDGSYSGPDSTPTIVMNSDITEVAVFTYIESYPLTMTAGPGGSVTPPSGDYPNGATIEITAIPDLGHSFVYWTGTGLGSYTGGDNPATITMLDAITEFATFQPESDVTLTTVADTGGTVTPPSGEYPYGSVVTLEAVPDSGYAFAAWVGEGEGSYTGNLNPVDVTLVSSITETALFEPTVSVTITTDPVGFPMVVDGDSVLSPQTYDWARWSRHDVAVDSLVAGPPGERHRFLAWNDGYTHPARQIRPVEDVEIHTAFYTLEYFLDFVDPPEGWSIPGDTWWEPGAIVEIEAIPVPGHEFDQWTGEGDGSYTGSQNPVSVTLNEPLVQIPSFLPIVPDPFGHEFSISASDTDPFVNTAVPAGGTRPLYFWATCLEEGLSALEAGVVTDMPVTGFTTSPDVYNVGTATDLLLAIGGCPEGPEVDFLIGHWSVVDEGGTFCLGPSSGGLFASIECSANFMVENPRLLGFSSTEEGPCLIDDNPCVGGRTLALEGEIRFEEREHALELRWTPSEPRSSRGWHVYRSLRTGGPYERLTRTLVPGGVVPRFLDEAVTGGLVYHYKLLEIRAGRPGSSAGPAIGEAPVWAPAYTAFTDVGPNPFRERTTLRFSVRDRSRTRLRLYDVSGRLVRRLVDGERESGYHDVVWNGRDDAGLRVTGGVYFARLEIGGFRATRKVLVLGPK